VSYSADALDGIFANMEYRIQGIMVNETVRLVDGKYIDRYFLQVYYHDKYVLYDFNGDGLKDAAVLLTESGGGSASWPFIAFLINERGTYVHKSTCDLPTKADINEMYLENGKVVVDMNVYDKELWVQGKRKNVKKVCEYAGPAKWATD